MRFKKIIGLLGGLAMSVAVTLSSMPLSVMAEESTTEKSQQDESVLENEDGQTKEYKTAEEDEQTEEDSKTAEEDEQTEGNGKTAEVDEQAEEDSKTAEVDGQTEDNKTEEDEAVTYNGIDTQSDNIASDDDMSQENGGGEATLGKGTQRICEIIMDKADSIKAGESSSEFVISLKDLGYDVEAMTWTADELGFEKITMEDEMSCLYPVSDKLGIDMNDVTLILRNEPDLYWWNTTYYQALDGFEILDGGNKISITGVSIYLPVSVKYRRNDDENNSWVDADCEALKTVKRAVDNAKKIVEAAKSYNDIEKLRYYSEQICNSNIYNHEYYDDLDKGGDLDTNASQYVYVFDDDDETNVVCEGYAKSLKLLCDMTDFDNKTIKCYNVTGFLYDVDANGELVNPGGHMWNIVSIDGKSYIIDLTNSDKNDKNESNQFNGNFFLNAPDRGSVETGYVYYDSVGYVYYPSMEKIYGNDVITLSDTDYEMPNTDSQAPTKNTKPQKSKGGSSSSEEETEGVSDSVSDSTEIANEPIIEGVKGWASLDEKLEQNLAVINVDLNGTDTIPAKVISTIAGKNVVMMVKINNDTFVTIDASQITPAEASEVKFISSKNADGSETIGVRSQNIDIGKSIVIYRYIGLDKVGNEAALYFENADKSLTEFRTSPVYENGFVAFEVPFVNANYKVALK